MITVKVLDISYEEFERIRDNIFVDSFVNMDLIAANYSPKKKIALITFINAESIPEELKRCPKQYHPVTPHVHDEKSAGGEH